MSPQFDLADAHSAHIRVGDAEGSLLVSGTTAFSTLRELCFDEVRALVAGNVCLARENEAAYVLRVLNPRISIRFSAGEFRSSLDELASQRPTANVTIFS